MCHGMRQLYTCEKVRLLLLLLIWSIGVHHHVQNTRGRETSRDKRRQQQQDEESLVPHSHSARCTAMRMFGTKVSTASGIAE